MNTFINQPIAPPKPPRKRKGNFFKRNWIGFQEFLANEKVRKITGSALVLFSIYLFIAFNSYLYLNIIEFPKNPDADKVEHGLKLFGEDDIAVENRLGKTGALLAHFFIYRWFGISSYVVILLLFLAGMRLFGKSMLPFYKALKYSFVLLLWVPATLALIFLASDDFHFLGGSFGYFINHWLNQSIGITGTAFLLFFVLFIFLTAKYDIPFRWFKKEIVPGPLLQNGQPMPTGMSDVPFSMELNIPPPVVPPPVETSATEPPLKKPEKTEDPLELTIVETKEETLVAEEEQNTVPEPEVINFDPKTELSDYQYPPPELLNEYASGAVNISREEQMEELNANKNRIVDTLRNYNVEVVKIQATVGPTVTLYEIIPAPGTRISRIRSLQDDIALSLSALGIRIIAPIPGKGTIGIEVPNRIREVVPMKSIITSERFKNAGYELPVGIGKTISNETYVVDLTRMPHMLMAGATGQGKSVGLNSIIASILFTKHPSQVKFVMIDPKKVELTPYNKIERHFLAKLPNVEEPIIFDTKKVTHTLNSLCIEMDNRLELLNAAEVNDIKPYNVKYMEGQLKHEEGHRYLPYLVIIIDEFGDLILSAGKEVEHPLTRLAQLARATGIHLVIATQRPSVNIITGSIKANFPTRIAFRVVSQIDSRTILDDGGAAQLIGKGDMLIRTGSDLVRLQCSFIDTSEIQKVAEFIGSQKGYPTAYALPEYTEEPEGDKGEIDASEHDALFDDAARIVVQHQQGSASLLQRRLKLGYNRAGRIIDQLEAAGIIGPFEGSKARQVLYKDLNSLEQFLRDLHNKDEQNGEQEQ